MHFIFHCDFCSVQRNDFLNPDEIFYFDFNNVDYHIKLVYVCHKPWLTHTHHKCVTFSSSDNILYIVEIMCFASEPVWAEPNLIYWLVWVAIKNTIQCNWCSFQIEAHNNQVNTGFLSLRGTLRLTFVKLWYCFIYIICVQKGTRQMYYLF